MDTREAGRRGGKATATRLTAEQRSRSARKAALARWKKTAKARKRHIQADYRRLDAD
jgi:hypothetical protein